MAKKQVAVLMGGMSSEHEVSLASGAKVAESLDATRYAVTPITISKDGRWSFPDCEPLNIFDAVARLKTLSLDCVFIALHGAFGEDGRIQGLLDLLELPYTTSGAAASGLAIDKLRSKAVACDAGIRVAAHVVATRAEWTAHPDSVLTRVSGSTGFPCVVKSPCQGSSVGLTIACGPEAFPESMAESLKYGDEVMIEQFVAGREVTCAVLDIEPGAPPKALPVTEIRPKTSSFFDYHAKYTPGASEEITPAPISPELTAEVQAAAIRAHRAIGCAIWSRNDFILGPDGPVWIEINTVPGLTPTSLYPQAAAATGIPYSELMGLFVEAAIARHARGR